MKFYKIENNTWVECEFNPSKKAIILYNDNLVLLE